MVLLISTLTGKFQMLEWWTLIKFSFLLEAYARIILFLFYKSPLLEFLLCFTVFHMYWQKNTRLLLSIKNILGFRAWKSLNWLCFLSLPNFVTYINCTLSFLVACSLGIPVQKNLPWYLLLLICSLLWL